jgi:hypothetical protein
MPIGIVRRAHSSQFQMWMSVPQIAVLRIRIIRSLWPGSGFLTRCRASPGPASAFTSAFIEEGSLDSHPVDGNGCTTQPITPSSRPARVNAATARSIWSDACAALICVRMRALPFGTTGKEKPIT